MGHDDSNSGFSALATMSSVWHILCIMLLGFSVRTVQAQVTVSGDAYGTLSAAIAAAGSGGTVHMNSGYSTTLTTPIALSNPVTLECDKGAKINVAADIDTFTVSAQNVRFVGACTMSGNKTTYPLANAIVSTSDYLEVSGWTFTGFNTYVLRFTGDHISIHDNYLMDVGGFGIWVKGKLTNSYISRNHIKCAIGGSNATSAMIAIIIHSNGSDVHSVSVDGNEITGTCGALGVEIGNFAATNIGTLPYDIHVTNNHATFEGVGGIGYSMATTHSVISGNSARITGTTAGYAAYENTSQYDKKGQFNSFIGNEAYGPYQNCQTLNGGSTHDVVMGLTCEGFTLQGIYVYTQGSTFGSGFTAEANNDSNVISGNTLIASSLVASSAPYTNGIVLVSNADTASITNTVITGNTVDMNQPSSTYNSGIFMAPYHGAINDTVLGPNIVKNALNGISRDPSTNIRGPEPTCDTTVATCDLGQAFTTGSSCGYTPGQVGGFLSGAFNAGATSCTMVFTPGVRATNGFACTINDLTTPANIMKQSATTTTTYTFTGNVGVGDLINFTCSPY